VVKEDMEVLFRSKKSRVSRDSSCNKTIRRKKKYKMLFKKKVIMFLKKRSN
jgi:hypothetical protein